MASALLPVWPSAVTQDSTLSCAGLPAVTWGPVEENAAGRGEVEALEELRVHQGQEHHLLERPDVVIQAAHLVEAHRGVHLARPGTPWSQHAETLLVKHVLHIQHCCQDVIIRQSLWTLTALLRDALLRLNFTHLEPAK